MEAREIVRIQKDIIKKFFPGLKPRRIKIVDAGGKFSGRAAKELEVDVNFLANCIREELKDLIKHELIHYYLPKQGHNTNFLKECKRLGLALKDDSYEYNRWYEEGIVLGLVEETPPSEEGIITAVRKKKPRWDYFWGEVVYNTDEGWIFRRLRRYANLSQKELAQRAGLSIYQIGLIEKSKCVFLLDIKNLKKYFQSCVRCFP
jgi:DNA-binding XRE family transcriptional regulator